jgi:hypothetical protein
MIEKIKKKNKNSSLVILGRASSNLVKPKAPPSSEMVSAISAHLRSPIDYFVMRMVVLPGPYRFTRE